MGADRMTTPAEVLGDISEPVQMLIPTLPPRTTRSPIHIIEFIGDGNAVIRRADGSEFLVMARDVAAVLREEGLCND